MGSEPKLLIGRNRQNKSMKLTRRELGRYALAAIPATQLLSAKPNSFFNGVGIGINAPISFRGLPGAADDIIANMTTVGLSTCELRLQPIEGFLRGTGATPLPNQGRRGGGGPPPGGAGRGRGDAGSVGATATDQGGLPGGQQPGGRGAPGGRGGRASLTPEQEAAQRQANEELDKWRLSLSSDKFTGFRKKFEDAGIFINILKVDNINNMSDDIVDYAFTVGKLVGAASLSTEIPLDASKRIGQFADKHKMLIGYHGHTNISDPQAFAKPESWETAMSWAKYNGVNLDIGHFTAANSTSPVPYLKKWRERVTHLHLKDRKYNNGANLAWGQGDTPIVEILQLIRDQKWPIQGMIEWEYRAPEGSNCMKELTVCLEFARKALMS